MHMINKKSSPTLPKGPGEWTDGDHYSPLLTWWEVNKNKYKEIRNGHKEAQNDHKESHWDNRKMQVDGNGAGRVTEQLERDTRQLKETKSQGFTITQKRENGIRSGSHILNGWGLFTCPQGHIFFWSIYYRWRKKLMLIDVKCTEDSEQRLNTLKHCDLGCPLWEHGLYEDWKKGKCVWNIFLPDLEGHEWMSKRFLLRSELHFHPQKAELWFWAASKNSHSKKWALWPLKQCHESRCIHALLVGSFISARWMFNIWGQCCNI